LFFVLFVIRIISMENKTKQELINELVESRKLLASLKESEELFRQIAENISKVFWISGPLGSRMIYVSPAYEEIWGYSRDNLFEKPLSFLDAVYPADRSKALTGLKEQLRHQFEMEYRIIRADGEIRWIRDRSFPMRNEEGEVYRIVGFSEDITEQKQFEEELKNSREQLRALSARMQLLQEEERTKIAREIHDEFGQALTALKIDLAWLGQRLLSDQDILHDKIEKMNHLIDATIETVRRISRELRPTVLDDLGLAAAIEWAIQEFQGRTSIECNLTVEPEDITLDSERSTAVFRILQEALTNIVRHSGATRVDIYLEKSDNRLSLEVRDNGRGITKNEIRDPKSLGLIGIKERALLWNGEISIEGTAEGTILMVKIPMLVSSDSIQKGGNN
jgi:PAS domain S-box-containing protein